jgi:hypothetical protein
VHLKQAGGGMKTKGLAIGLALLALASCARQAPVVVQEAPPGPVGHIYVTRVQVPPLGTSRRLRMTPDQSEEVQQAFNVIALKSALMVAALSCGEQDKYDAFMTAFQPHILAEQHVMDAYFRRMGRSGQTQEDAFVTLLANNQSVTGIGQGSIFCLNNTAEFNAVLTLKTPDSLDSFVTDLPPGASVTTPAVAVATTAKPVVVRHTRVAYTHHVVHHTHPAVTTTSQPANKPVKVSTSTH